MGQSSNRANLVYWYPLAGVDDLADSHCYAWKHPTTYESPDQAYDLAQELSGGVVHHHGAGVHQWQRVKVADRDCLSREMCPAILPPSKEIPHVLGFRIHFVSGTLVIDTYLA